MSIWRYPSNKDLRENDLLDYFDMFFRTSLKWVILFFIVFVVFIFKIFENQSSKIEKSNQKIEQKNE